ncbi:hypothetical protein GLX27_002901 [Malassezia furfur]|uniref:PinX1-related protein 1 n=1 Tax=Malassezia furfur TaxID=55194 RepID=A0ABY8ERR1_MALFU|nr:hypothetical protein GLX27_002901 [Malassezia furfur]
MASMGWAPGTGLGTSGQGMATNLTVSMKLDNKGIGAHRHEKEAREQNKADAWIGAGGDLGMLFERLNSANSSEQASPASPASLAPAAAAVAPAPVPAVSRLAHRAKFRRAKAMVGIDASRMNEILGISSAESSARNSPAPALESRASPATSAAKPAKRSREESEEETSESPEPSATKKSKKKDKKASGDSTKAERKLQKALEKEERKREKREKKAAKKGDAAHGVESSEKRTKDKPKKSEKTRASHGNESGPAAADPPEAPTDTLVEESNLIVSPGGQFVFQYLSNKLMRRRAEVQLRRREAGKWW